MFNAEFKIIKTNLVLVLSAIFIGCIISIVAQYFALSTSSIFTWIQNNKFVFLEFGNINLFPVIACFIGSVFVCLIIKYLNISRWHGPADTIYAAHQRGGTLDIKAGFFSTIACFFSISGGASVGLYGPLVHFGATCAAFIRRRKFMPNIPHDIIIGAGVAAAISSVFSAPIAGIVFSLEIIIRHFSMRALTSISLSSITASIVAKEMNIMTPILKIDEVSFELFEAVPGLLIIGIISSIIAISFMKSLFLSSKISSNSKIPFMYRPLIPGILCGIFVIIFPDVTGLGSETIIKVITTDLSIIILILILFLKIFLTSLCIGFGLFGGVFSPALLIGAATGAIIYNIPIANFDQNLLPIFAISSMAAVTSSVIGGPVTAMILVFELTGSYEYAIASILPISLCNLLTYILFGSSFFDAQLKSRNIQMGFGREHILMTQTKILNYVSSNFLSLKLNSTNKNNIAQFKKMNSTEAYFIDKEQNYLGKLKLINILNKPGNSINFKEKDPIIINPNQNIYEIMNILKDFVGESIPVVNNKNKFIGIISENDVLKAYDQITQTIRNIEKN